MSRRKPSEGEPQGHAPEPRPRGGQPMPGPPERTADAAADADRLPTGLTKDGMEPAVARALPDESQNYERKREWNEGAMETICAFANADGGVLEIGRDDAGRTVGLKNPSKLMKDVPNRIADSLQMVTDVDLIQENGKQFIRVSVKPSGDPVSYRGVFYRRSGETNQVLNGPALADFLLKKQGRPWDGLTVPNISVGDLDGAAIQALRKALSRGGRLSEGFGNLDIMRDDARLLDRLDLLDGGMLTRAAVLLFHEDPTRHFGSAHVDIGYFVEDNGTAMIRRDRIQGPLITMPDRVLDTLWAKYLSAEISFEGRHREEIDPVPPRALREAVTNAIVHRDYAPNMHTQIRVYEDRLIIHNAGSLPDSRTFEDLAKHGKSLPHNRHIAKAFFYANLIESFGTGIETIMAQCKEAGKPPPLFEASNGVITVTLFTGAADGNGKLKREILRLLKENPNLTREDLKKLL